MKLNKKKILKGIWIALISMVGISMVAFSVGVGFMR